MGVGFGYKKNSSDYTILLGYLVSTTMQYGYNEKDTTPLSLVLSVSSSAFFRNVREILDCTTNHWTIMLISDEIAKQPTSTTRPGLEVML